MIPAVLHGRWIVDGARLQADRHDELLGGVIIIAADRFETHSFPKTVFDRVWDDVTVRGQSIYADNGYEDVCLDVCDHQGDRLVVELTGVDALGWRVGELPLLRC